VTVSDFHHESSPLFAEQGGRVPDCVFILREERIGAGFIP